MAYNFSQLKSKVTDTEEWLKREFSSVRTGRATPAILDAVTVDSYGSKMHVNQLASISVEDARSLRVVPWDMEQVRNIEVAVQNSNLGLSVNTDEKGLRIIFPELTSERRESLVKLVKQKHEEARIALRKERERVWEDIQEKEKKSELTEDEKFRLKDEMQKMIDEANKKLDESAERKEREIQS
jgi:ribosome recycling factor